MNFDPSDVAFLEGGEHVQHRVEAAPPETQKVKSFREFQEKKFHELRQLVCLSSLAQRERDEWADRREINDVKML